MNRILILLLGIVILNGCAQSTSFVGPSYTLVKSGSVIQAGNSVAMSYGFKKTFNQMCFYFSICKRFTIILCISTCIQPKATCS